MVPERGQHRDKSVTLVCEEKGAERVEDVCSVEYAGEQPLDLVLTDTLREECDCPEELPGIRAEFLEHGGGE